MARQRIFNRFNPLLFWLIAVIIGSTLAMLIAPMESPDENQHIARAYLIAQGTLMLKAPQGMMSGGDIDRSLAVFIDTYLSQALTRTAVNNEKKAHVYRAGWRRDGSKTFMQIPGTGYYLPLIYLPHAAGLKIAQLLGLSIGVSYQFCRLTVFLTCMGLLAASFRLARPNAVTIALLALPMSLFQMVSPTLDGLTICLALLIVSTLIYRLDQGNSVGWFDSWGLSGMIFLLVTSRTHLLPLLALPLYLYWRQKKIRDLIGGMLIAAASCAWVVYAVRTTVDLRIVRDCTTMSLIGHYLGHPFDFMQILFASLRNDVVFDFYAKSFVGILGWLNIPLGASYYPVLWTGLTACVLVSCSLPKSLEEWRVRFVIGAIGVLSVLLVFFALLVTSTPYPAHLIAGVQGRYFTIPFLLLGYALAGLHPPVTGYRCWFGWVCVSLAVSTSLVALVQALRYGSLT